MEKQRRPGGRTARVQDAIFSALLEELVAKGYSGLSIVEIAERADVHRSTIHRRWEKLDDLLVAALASLTETPVYPEDTGDLLEDLTRYAQGIAAMLNGPAGRILRAVIVPEVFALPGVQELKQRLFLGRRELSDAIIRRAIDRGQIPAQTVPSDAIDYLVAPLYFRLLLEQGPLYAALAKQSAVATDSAARAGSFCPR
ncbi:hypothetical protein AQ436_15745 [Arthrobacter sp. EpRS66]|nr:hypothetical protein AQ436_15745 [Arthrobacter sp. EpRS66]